MPMTIALLTTGGDAPGMNAAIRGVVRTAISEGIEVFGIEEGYSGLLKNYFIDIGLAGVSGIINKGGTILRTLRSKDFHLESKRKIGYENLFDHKIDGIIVIGGDGSRKGMYAITKETGIPSVFIPASIDNDVFGTDYTIGFDTAVNTALDAIDRIRDTAASHERVFIVEIMGRDHGFLTLEVGLAGGAELILIPELKQEINMDKICNTLFTGFKRGKNSSIIAMAEGVGMSSNFARIISKKMNIDAKYSVLGYIQRGGTPTAFSRKLGLVFGYEAVKIIKKMKAGQSKMTGIQNNKLVSINLIDVINKEKKIDKKLYEMNKIFAI